ncbi:unnamed protein product [Brassica rapa]|uniref:BnaA01g07370D protein n=2 Tax=Brassica TaxID=3705 RepID=A0A078I076_BRANA|nr:unnamed protein product [Brassica rapa]CDY43507.1 BnaA01g07370D [Brassica napus]VDC74303.1 unnamed protein product [Brassica rapa]
MFMFVAFCQLFLIWFESKSNRRNEAKPALQRTAIFSALATGSTVG